MTRLAHLLVPILLLLAGCLATDAPTTTVAPNPFAPPGAAPAALTFQTSNAAPPIEIAARVDSLGHKIIACNPQIGMRPVFTSIGDPKPAIWHMGAGQVWITEGLVKQCNTEGQLAAVLCRELGKMVSEREALAPPGTRNPDRLPPIDVAIGNDRGDSFGSADGTALYEKVKLGPPPRRSTRLPLPPDPAMLARGYLKKACFAPEELDSVAPLLRETDKNFDWERQMTNPPARPFTQ